MHMMFELFYWLVVVHAVTDLGLQSEWCGSHKAMRVNNVYNPSWVGVLAGHSILQGGGVAFVTGSIPLGLAETVVHFCTDFLSSNKYIRFRTDQIIHITSRVVWTIIACRML